MHWTAVHEQSLLDLGVQPIDAIPTRTPAGAGRSFVYPTKVSFPGLQVAGLPMDRVIGSELKWHLPDGRDVIMLLGRDLLKYFLLIYNGKTSEVTLAFFSYWDGANEPMARPREQTDAAEVVRLHRRPQLPGHCGTARTRRGHGSPGLSCRRRWAAAAFPKSPQPVIEAEVMRPPADRGALRKWPVDIPPVNRFWKGGALPEPATRPVAHREGAGVSLLISHARSGFIRGSSVTFWKTIILYARPRVLWPGGRLRFFFSSGQR